MINPSDWIAADLVWLVTLRWNGRVWYFATQAVEIAGPDGGDLLLLSCENPVDLVESIGRLSQQQRGASAALRVVLDVDLVEYRREGWRLDSATCEVAYVTARAGASLQTYQQREVVVSGRLREPQYGDPYQATGTLIASVEATNVNDLGLTAGGGLVVSGTAFSSTADAVLANHGKPYPIVFGFPGAAGRPGTPGYTINRRTGATSYSDVLVAGHLCSTQSVQVVDADGTAQVNSILTTVDQLGRAYSYVEIASTDTIDWLSDQFWIGWTSTSSTSFTLPRAGRTGGVRAVGDLMLWLIARSTLDFDEASWFSLAPYLNAYRVDGYINEEISPWEYITRALVDIAPISITGGTGGLRPTLNMAPPISSAQPVVASARFRRVRHWQIEGKDTDVVNQVLVKYARDGQQGEYREGVAVGVDTEHETTGARYSRDLYGTRTETIELPVVDNRATAIRVGLDRIAMHGLLPESTTYLADTEYGWIRAGDWLALTDDTDNVEDLLVQIIERRYTGAGWEFDVLRIDDPQRDAGRV